MASYVFLELDTTTPDIQIILPPYSTQISTTHITVEANEQLGSYQDFYIIDSLGARHDLGMTLSDDGTEYVTATVLSRVAIGTATFYAQVKDTVDNVSALVSRTFSMFQTEVLSVSLTTERARKVELSNSVSIPVTLQVSAAHSVTLVDKVVNEITLANERAVKVEIVDVKK